uniref:hypothetical protein n=1 Tax=Acinetobacter baumannii TaxID=470 RepID=UPI00339B6C4A
AVQARSPWMAKDINLLQRIYHRATKLVSELEHLTYLDRLKRLKLFGFSLYKIMTDEQHPLQGLFVRQESRVSRTHGFLLMVPHSRVNYQRYFYAVRVCFFWNALPQYVVHSSNLELIKANLDAYMESHCIIEPHHNT